MLVVACGSRRAQPRGLGGPERVGSRAKQFAGVGVEEHQGVFVDADADAASGQDLRRQDEVLAEGDGAGGGDGAVDLDRTGEWQARHWWWSGRSAAVAQELGEVVDRQVRAH